MIYRERLKQLAEMTADSGRFVDGDTIREMASLLLERQWVPVTEMLPEEGKLTQVAVDGVTQELPCTRNGEEWCWLDVDSDPMPLHKASHWRYLPLEPPEEGQ